MYVLFTTKSISLARSIPTPLEFFVELKKGVYLFPFVSLIAVLTNSSPLTPLQFTSLVSEMKITSVFKFLIELIFTSKFALEPVRFSEFTFWEEKLMGGGVVNRAHPL